MSVTILTLVLAFGAIARVTRFVNSDLLFQGVRARVTAYWGPDHKISYLMTCQWCASVWTAPAITATAWAWGSTAWWTFGAFALTASYAYGLLSMHLDD